jgi:hypothetical protein
MVYLSSSILAMHFLLSLLKFQKSKRRTYARQNKFIPLFTEKQPIDTPKRSTSSSPFSTAVQDLLHRQ